MKNNNIEKQLEEMFAENRDEMTEEQDTTYRALVAKNVKGRKYSKIKFILRNACTMCMLLLFALPFSLFFLPKEHEIYYSKDEADKKPLTQLEVETIINNHYSRYDFLFNYSFDSALGYYAPDSDKLLSINFKYKSLNENVNILVNLIVSEQFIFTEHDSYITNAEMISIESNKYTLYKITKLNFYNKYMRGYIEYPKYKIYFYLDNVNDSIFDQFINE